MRKTILRITAIILVLASILTCCAALRPGAAQDSADKEPDRAAAVSAPRGTPAARREAPSENAVPPSAPAEEPETAEEPAADGLPEPAPPALEPEPAEAPEEVPDKPNETAEEASEEPAETAKEVSEKPAAEEESRYAALTLSDADLELLARIVYLEARGEPYEGQAAVAEVVLNRVLSDRFPDTVAGVLYQTGQFTPAAYLESTTPGEEQYQAAADAADGLDCVTGAEVVFFSGAPYNDRVYAVIGNHYFCEL